MVLAQLRTVLLERATYGYRRATALVNRHFGTRYNRKRVRRVLALAGWTLPVRGPRRSGRPHRGRVARDGSNERWCSDTLTVACWSGEVVEIGFALDCCAVPAVVARRGRSRGGHRALMRAAVGALRWSGPGDPVAPTAAASTARHGRGRGARAHARDDAGLQRVERHGGGLRPHAQARLRGGADLARRRRCSRSSAGSPLQRAPLGARLPRAARVPAAAGGDADGLGQPVSRQLGSTTGTGLPLVSTPDGATRPYRAGPFGPTGAHPVRHLPRDDGSSGAYCREPSCVRPLHVPQKAAKQWANGRVSGPPGPWWEHYRHEPVTRAWVEIPAMAGS
ncbi:MAG: IS3 family transposase [Gemmatimonadetes bacterium]|nr:IS3 family transposase [Gemmatimonadota bacterium]